MKISYFLIGILFLFVAGCADSADNHTHGDSTHSHEGEMHDHDHGDHSHNSQEVFTVEGDSTKVLADTSHHKHDEDGHSHAH